MLSNMAVKVAIRLVTPRSWTGGINYLLNVCGVLRTYTSDIEPIFFAPADIDTSLASTITNVTGKPPVELRERARKDDAFALAGIGDEESFRTFREHKIDLVYETTGYYGRKSPIPILPWIPDFQHRRLPQMFGRLQWFIREMRFRSVLYNRNHLVLSSEDAYGDLKTFYKNTKPKPHVIPFAISMKETPSYADGEARRLELGLPERFFFLPNQFWPHKNHMLVVEALGRLGKDAPVVVVSGGPDARNPGIIEALKSRLAELGMTDRFRFVGHLPYKTILALNARADGLINPSLFEGWSTTVEEAKALGTPLVLSSLGVHKEQAESTAIYFDPHDVADCAEAIRRAMVRPARVEEDRAALEAKNRQGQRVFAERLRSTFSEVLNAV